MQICAIIHNLWYFVQKHNKNDNMFCKNTNTNILGLTKKEPIGIGIEKKGRIQIWVDKKGRIPIQIQIFILVFANMNTNTKIRHTL